MRKFFIIGLGVLLGSGALMFSSDARTNCCSNCKYSVDGKMRYSSQGCCKDSKRKIRTFSNRIGPYQYRQRSRSQIKCDNCGYSRNIHASRRHDVVLHKQYRIVDHLSTEDKIAIQNEMFGYNDARKENNYESPRHVIRNGNYVPKYDLTTSDLAKLNRTVNEEKYVVEMPSEFQADENGIYRSNKTSLAFRITRVGQCSSAGFTNCSRVSSKEFRDDQRLNWVTNEKSFFRWNQTVHNQFNYFATLTESFEGELYGVKNAYFIFSAVNPDTKEIYRIEAVSNLQDKSQAAEAAFDIFETFRFAQTAI